MQDAARVEDYLAKGFCCAEAIVRFGLGLRNEENEQLASVTSGLCRGMWSGCNCGALAGGALLLSMFDRRAAAEFMIPDLVAWFDKSYGREYGSCDCRDIAGDRMQYRPERCKTIVISVCDYSLQMLRSRLII